MKLDNKVAIVTGAGNGIGEALARRFASAGARGVVVSDLSAADAHRVADHINASGGRAIGVAADVANEDALRGLVETAQSRFGPVDIFCSNAGIVDEGGVDTAEYLWERSWNVNVMAHVRAARAVLPGMLARRSGYLVSTCSAAGLLTSPGAAPYSVTKHAAVALAEWLAIMHGDAGIRVSVICPQAVRTKLLTGSIESGNAASGAFARMGRLLEPDEVAACAMQGIEAERFLILPHPEVQGYWERKVSDIDRWLAGMRRFLVQAREQTPTTTSRSPS
ncbi:SDR family NAD(P)-dependent oxidoreductase [Comamonadaceae bacterium G21597-S1]|nr:SDR family NAD(P)-dependent oxidoreductase [Comamonadaceae bacterium G21597-S1]